MALKVQLFKGFLPNMALIQDLAQARLSCGKAK
jgi:hypothetical protein